MIALLAAVDQETILIRQGMSGIAEEVACGLPLISGHILDVPVCLAHGGVGKAAAAAATIALLHHSKADALILFGCGGSYPNSGLGIGDMALASSECFGDEGVMTAHGFRDLAEIKLPIRIAGTKRYNAWPLDEALCAWATPILETLTRENNQAFLTGPFVTVSTCTGTLENALAIQRRTFGICENMEGAAVALACEQLCVPMLELRGISNHVEDRDTGRWDLTTGMTSAQQAVLNLLRDWSRRGGPL